MTANDSTSPTIIAFMSGKGGVGKTMLAVAAARELSLAQGTLILDFDFFNRGLSGLMSRGVAKFRTSPPALFRDQCALHWEAREVASNLYTVAFPDTGNLKLTELADHDVNHLASQLTGWINELCAKLNCKTVVLDCHGGPDALSFASAIIAHKTLLISEPDRITMYGTLHFLRRLAYLSIDSTNVHLVFNKVVESFTSRFLFKTYNEHLRTYFNDKPLLAAFPLELYLTKRFEHDAFVTDDFPGSMLARKVQVMLADLLGRSDAGVVSERARRIPRLVAYWWKHSFGRTPKILELDFVMTLSAVTLVVFVITLFLDKFTAYSFDALREQLMIPLSIGVVSWALFVTLLIWSRKITQQLTPLSRRRQWISYACLAGTLTFLWLSPVVTIASFLLANPSIPSELYPVRFVWYAILIVVFFVWSAHVFHALRDLRYSRRRIEPTMGVVIGAFVLISWGALVDGIPFSERIEEMFEIERPFSFERLDSNDLPDRSQIVALELDTWDADELDVRELGWFEFSVDSHGWYVVRVNSEDGDPTVALFGPNDVKFLRGDDDGGSETNSKIHLVLEEGTYYLAIRGYRGSALNYLIMVRKENSGEFSDRS